MIRRSVALSQMLVLFALAAPGIHSLSAQGAAVRPGAVLDIGSHRELFLDDWLVDRLVGPAELRLHHPVAQETVMVNDKSWEGCGTGYHSIFKDGDRYRMYYRGWQVDPLHEANRHDSQHPDPHLPAWCYAESADGIHWQRPVLAQFAFAGSKANNIISAQVRGAEVDPSCLAVFKDDNPNAAPDARYKAILLASNPRGMLACKSPDGIHWSPMSDRAIITDGAFDSQNLVFWDRTRGEYRAYWRYFTSGVTTEKNWQPKGIRAIRTATSKDFLHWEHQTDLRYVDSPAEQLYTSQVKPYDRAPQLLLGFPTRYLERGWSEAMRALPDRENRESRAKASERYGTALSEVLVMASRDGVTFKRWNEAFMPPGVEHPGTWAYGDQYIAWQLVETKSPIEGAPDELSFYATENAWIGKSNSLRRYTLRLDGFVSAEAPLSGGELITRPLRFQGEKLSLNFATSAAGSVRVEIQDPDGQPLPGFALADCPPLFGDTIERAVTWARGGNVSAIAGRPVRLRFVLSDADLYSFRFAGR